MKPLRIAMVGAGSGRGQNWMATLTKLSEAGFYDFCALCEIVPEKAKESAKRWNVKAYTNLLDLLDNEPLDVLLNGAPPDANVMVVSVAAKRKVHALTEIPMAPTLSLARFMMETAKENGVKLEVCEQVWLWAKEQLKRKIIDAGLIGEITHARLYYTNKADYHGINAIRMLIRSPVKRVLGYTQVVKIPRQVISLYATVMVMKGFAVNCGTPTWSGCGCVLLPQFQKRNRTACMMPDLVMVGRGCLKF